MLKFISGLPFWLQSAVSVIVITLLAFLLGLFLSFYWWVFNLGWTIFN